MVRFIRPSDPFRVLKPTAIDHLACCREEPALEKGSRVLATLREVAGVLLLLGNSGDGYFALEG